MDKHVLEQVAGFLKDATKDGLYPIVGYAIEGDSMFLLTTNIARLSYALAILKDTGYEYNLGRSLPCDTLERLAKENPHVFRLHSTRTISGLAFADRAEIGRVISIFGAPFFKQKGFALVDICGFSRLDHAQQLSQLYSLTNVLSSSIRRCYRFCSSQLALPSSFGYASTGDGFYIWHDNVGGNADVATFMVLVCIMTFTEFMRQKNEFPMRLRAAFVIDSAYMIYDPTVQISPTAVASNAVGPATNAAARLVSAARPSQILVGDFKRPGQVPNEVLTPQTFIKQASELFRSEGIGAASLSFQPDKLLRVTDKHGSLYYCYNLVGEVPNKDKDESVSRQSIGLKLDLTEDIQKIAFQEEPWSR